MFLKDHSERRISSLGRKHPRKNEKKMITEDDDDVRVYSTEGSVNIYT